MTLGDIKPPNHRSFYILRCHLYLSSGWT